jgi:hypothetical protein
MKLKITLLALSLLAGAAYGQGSASPADSLKKAAATKAAQDVARKDAPQAEVYDVYNLDHSDPHDPEHFRAGLGDKIRIRVHGMKALLAKAKQQGKEIKLFLANRQVDDIKPTSGAPDVDDSYFEFSLQRTATNDKVWAELLGKPVKGNFFFRPTEVSIGLADTYAEKSVFKAIQLTRIRQTWFWGGLLFLLAYTFLLILYSIKKDILRENGPDLSALNIPSAGRLPYSLGKVQMAFWFSLVLASFLFIWMITGNFDIITTGVLGLIGISATTALGAVTIDDNKSQAAITDILELRKQRAALDAEIKALPVADPAIPAKKLQLTDLDKTIAKKEASLQIKTVHFLDDILTDANGISFHRLQMFIWTLVLGVIFVYSVWASLIMPDFSATLLTLQGITAGTYLGFKFPEKQS